jgi:H+/Cl- antiporter ClcA
LRGEVTTSDYMEAVVLGDGKIAARRTLLKCLSALFTIASGGSIGREGPLVQLSALAASLAGRMRKWYSTHHPICHHGRLAAVLIDPVGAGFTLWSILTCMTFPC